MQKVIYFIFSILLTTTSYYSQCINTGFESTVPGNYINVSAITGWTISSTFQILSCNTATTFGPGSSEFSVHATPIHNLPYIGTLPHSPLGGSNIAQLNNFSLNTKVTKLTHTFSVTSANAAFHFAYAGAWGTGHPNCCDNGFLAVTVKDCLGSVLGCSSLSFQPVSIFCPNGATQYTTNVSHLISWTNWQVRTIDLSPFIGSCVTIEVINSKCTGGGHMGSAFFDAACGPQNVPTQHLSSMLHATPEMVDFCAGSNQATLHAPMGYSTYSWIPPANHPALTASQATQAILTTTNAIAGNVFTLQLSTFSGCLFTSTIQLIPSNVHISSLGTSPTCSLGSSGTATVYSTGSGSGYNYTWLNSSNVAVGTSSVVSGLAAGNYSLNISAVGSPSCGTSSATFAISTLAPNEVDIFKPYCNSTSIVLSPTLSGNNYQWYNNITAINGASGGNASSYTVTPLINYSIYRLTFTNAQGCKDSLKFTLNSISPGPLFPLNTPSVCTGATNSSLQVNFSPSMYAGSLNSYSIVSSGLTAPFSFSGTSTGSTFAVNNTIGAGTYSFHLSDGLCNYTSGFTVHTYPPFDFTLNPAPSVTVCNGNLIFATAQLSSSVLPGQFTFSWSPATFVFGNNPTTQQIVISPTVALGTSSTIVYTTTVISNDGGCAISKQFHLTVTDLPTPTITSIPALCSNSPVYTISAYPGGGVFTSNAAQGVLSSSGLLTSSLAPVGINSFSYSISSGTCSSASTATYSINPVPSLLVAGSFSLCAGNTTTLYVSGADTYSWTGGSNGSTLSINPAITSIYTVTGTNMQTNCSDTKSLTVTVFPRPTIDVSGDTILCIGEITTLFANGAKTYTWGSTNTTQSISLSPSTSTNYILEGSDGICFTTKTISIIVSECTGILESKKDNNTFTLYPNPTEGKLFLENPYEIKITLCTIAGKILLEKTFQKGRYDLDLTDYPNGVYLLKTIYKNETKIKKLVKNN